MRKTIFVLLLMMLSAIGMTGLVSAATSTTINAPATSGAVSGSYGFNVTCPTVVTNDTFGVWWIIWDIQSASTANSSWARIINTTSNGTVSYHSAFNAAGVGNTTSFNTVSVQDSNNYEVRARCYNTTGGLIDSGDTNTAVVFDNFAPSISGISVSDKGTLNKDSVLSATILAWNTTDDAGTEQVRFGSNIYNLVRSGDTVSYTVTKGNPPDGTYDITFTATDGTNSTSSKVYDVKVDAVPEGAVGISEIAQPVADQIITQQQNVRKGMSPLMIAVIAVVGIYVFGNMIGGKKR